MSKYTKRIERLKKGSKKFESFQYLEDEFEKVRIYGDKRDLDLLEKFREFQTPEITVLIHPKSLITYPEGYKHILTSGIFVHYKDVIDLIQTCKEYRQEHNLPTINNDYKKNVLELREKDQEI